MTDIIVTTPKTEMQISAEEAENIKDSGGGDYFRVFNHTVPKIAPGERVFYVEDGFLRGFAVVKSIERSDGVHWYCDSTNRDWGSGAKVVMDATTWKSITPWLKPGGLGRTQNLL